MWCWVPGAARAHACPGSARTAAPTLTLSPCELTHPLRLTVVPAECGVLSVAENPADAHSRRIGLHVARVPAISRRKLADPLFVLAGGPGQAASAFYATVAGAFARINRDRDIVLLDQRGTGGSNLLDCPEHEPRRCTANPTRRSPRSTRACLAALAPRAAVAYYTTSIAVQDLEQVRRALGYGRIDIYGVSYGTRVAQHYIRRFPQAVRAVILDGVLPPQLAIGPAVALDAENALRAVLARCAAQAAVPGALRGPAGRLPRAARDAAKGPGARAAAGSCQRRAAAAGLRQRPAGDGAAPGELFLRLLGAAAAAAAQRARERGTTRSWPRSSC